MFRLLSTALLLAACSATQADAPERATPAQTGSVAALGIPYATAERWTLPLVNTDWKTAEPFDDFGPACPQDGQTIMIEDCLFLNVFAPANAKDAPVVVWFHGGGLRAGEGGSGPSVLTQDGIVVVTFNYRLGKLGFMDWAGWYPDDPRNFGQADMVAALEWVQDNIQDFGGNADKVTLAGHSAGGMGVQLMMGDPRAEGLFNQAWAHAGYAAWPFPKAYNPSEKERQLIKYRPLPIGKSAAELVAETPHYRLPFTDTPALREQPSVLFQRGEYRKVPYVSGANSFDGQGTLFGAGFTVEGFLAKYDTPVLREAYADDFAVSDAQAAQRIFGDMRYLASSAVTANAAKGWLFYYDETRLGTAGAGHGQQYPSAFSYAPSAFRDAMSAFIKTGDPGWSPIQSGRVGRFSPNLQNSKNNRDIQDKLLALTASEKIRDDK